MPKARLAENGVVLFYCSGCDTHHAAWTDPNNPNNLTGGKWSWNGSLESPTFSPSILVRGSHYPSGTEWPTDEEHARILGGETIQMVPTVCHSFVRDGKIQYLSDCTHKFAGQTIELPDIDSV